MEHDDFSGDISSDIEDDFSDEHEHEQTSEEHKAEMIAFRFFKMVHTSPYSYFALF